MIRFIQLLLLIIFYLRSSIGFEAVSNKLFQVTNYSFSDDWKSCEKRSVFANGKNVPIFWLNLKDSTNRAKFSAQQLKLLGFRNQRIGAFTPADALNITMKLIPAIQQTPTELACLISHLFAIHTAINDKTLAPDSPIALIMEDDLVMELDINFMALAATAPSDFGVLQLMTSSSGYVTDNWDFYHNASMTMAKTLAKARLDKDAATIAELNNTSASVWGKWSWQLGHWSTWAYIVHKERFKSFINQVVTLDANGNPSFQIINPSFSLFPCSKDSARRGQCTIPLRIVADYYVYLSGSPTYRLMVPAFNGAKAKSTISSRHTKNHDLNLEKIQKVLSKVVNNASILPSFMKPFSCG